MVANTTVSIISESNMSSLVPDFSVMYFGGTLATTSLIMDCKKSTVIHGHTPAILAVKHHPAHHAKPDDPEKRRKI
jgi:hypothetical protein